MAKRRVVRKYTPIGRRIARFGPQHKIARLLGVSQQTISKKCRGKIAIMLSDLETLAKKLDVALGVFFSAEELVCELKCPKCGRMIWHTYTDLVDVGAPLCSCDTFMEMVN